MREDGLEVGVSEDEKKEEEKTPDVAASTKKKQKEVVIGSDEYPDSPDRVRALIETESMRVYLHHFIAKKFAVDFEIVASHLDDIVQDTLLKAVRDSHKYDPNRGATLRSWLSIIALNKVYDFLRKVRRTVGKEVFVDTSPGEMGGTVFSSIDLGSNPEQLLVEAERQYMIKEVIRDRIKKLPRLQRKAIEGRLSGKAGDEIAAELGGISRKTVYSAIHKGKEALVRGMPEEDKKEIEKLLA